MVARNHPLVNGSINLTFLIQGHRIQTLDERLLNFATKDKSEKSSLTKLFCIMQNKYLTLELRQYKNDWIA